MSKLAKVYVGEEMDVVTLDNGNTYKILESENDCSQVWGIDDVALSVLEVKNGQVFVLDKDGYFSAAEARSYCQSSGECSVDSINKFETLILGLDLYVAGNQLVMAYNGCSESSTIIG